MTTTPAIGSTDGLHSLLLDAHRTGNALAVFTDHLTTTVEHLHDTDLTLDRTAALQAVDALEHLTALTYDIHDGRRTGDFITELDQAIDNLRLNHSEGDCQWPEFCTVRADLAYLTALTAAYQRLHADTTAPTANTTGDRH
jgi:hypothetical protein